MHTNGWTGKRIVELQASLTLLNMPKPKHPDATSTAEPVDEYGRVPYEHPALGALENITEETKAKALDKSRLARLAENYGLGAVTRWRPKKVSLQWPF